MEESQAANLSLHWLTTTLKGSAAETHITDVSHLTLLKFPTPINLIPHQEKLGPYTFVVLSLHVYIHENNTPMKQEYLKIMYV